jgi:hypothetical protein
MKYTRLTKEQLEELHPEFITFLATQTIDKKEWDDLKKNTPEIALQEIDVFSDLIWDKALTNVRFVDHFSKNHIFLFKCHDTFLESIIVNTSEASVDFFTTEGLEWLGNNLFSDAVTIQTGKKEVAENRNEEVFKIIENGGIISKGDLYSKLITLINVS